MTSTLGKKLGLHFLGMGAKLWTVHPDLPPSGRGELLKGHAYSGGSGYNQRMKIKPIISILSIFIIVACGSNIGENPASPPTGEPASSPTDLPSTETFTAMPFTETFTPIPTFTFTFTPLPTDTPSNTPVPVVESLKAVVTAGKLSCRYGPGAEYLYLFAFNETSNIKLVGRTDANSWVWVANKNSDNRDNNCWVNAKYLNIAGDPKMLPIVYPGIATLPVSPYYPGPSWASATRNGNSVEITWETVTISPGKYADEFMHQYIIEVWRCEAGQIIFETLGTNYPAIIVKNDEAGCNTPSHGRVFVQEKHGYGGPAEVPWPQP